MEVVFRSIPLSAVATKQPDAPVDEAIPAASVETIPAEGGEPGPEEPEPTPMQALRRPPGRAVGWDRNGPPPGLLQKVGAERAGFEMGSARHGRGRNVAADRVAATYGRTADEAVASAS